MLMRDHPLRVNFAKANGCNGDGILVAAPIATVEIKNSRVLHTTGLLNNFGGTLKNSNNKIFDNGINLRGS
jgi:hypothetical protein